eukprot:TRINITY_DN1678_c0_g1_i1.p1 TRINITY_DN1678_c0_g1~~TRINITY_DN1678_c0_g1_i1.p1  ORF type:complete len:502 (+),score=62.99 TRINITY_DN1678_c0_g1_i1:38-1543(+)
MAEEIEKQLEDLKEQYFERKRQLGFGCEILNSHRKIQRRKKEGRQKFVDYTVDIPLMQQFLEEILSACGPCHLNTLTEYIHQKWERIRKNMYSVWNGIAMRKSVHLYLCSKECFARTPSSELYWYLKSHTDSHHFGANILEFLVDYMKNKTGTWCSVEEVLGIIKSRVPSITQAKLKDYIRLIISTDDNFISSSMQRGYFTLHIKKRKRIVALPSTGNHAARKTKRPKAKRARTTSPNIQQNGKRGRTRDARNQGGRKKRPRKEESPWICCDHCHEWVQAKNDPIITDISLYDDSNPNHLDYYCPSCRSRGMLASQPLNLESIDLDGTRPLDVMEAKLIKEFKSGGTRKKRSDAMREVAELEKKFVYDLHVFKNILCALHDKMVQENDSRLAMAVVAAQQRTFNSNKQHAREMTDSYRKFYQYKRVELIRICNLEVSPNSDEDHTENCDDNDQIEHYPNAKPNAHTSLLPIVNPDILNKNQRKELPSGTPSATLTEQSQNL